MYAGGRGGVSSGRLFLPSFRRSFLFPAVRVTCIGSLQGIKKTPVIYTGAYLLASFGAVLYVVINLLHLIAVATKIIRFAGFGVAVVVPAFEVYPLAVGLYPVAPDPLCGSYF